MSYGHAYTHGYWACHTRQLDERGRREQAAAARGKKELASRAGEAKSAYAPASADVESRLIASSGQPFMDRLNRVTKPGRVQSLNVTLNASRGEGNIDPVIGSQRGRVNADLDGALQLGARTAFCAQR